MGERGELAFATASGIVSVAMVASGLWFSGAASEIDEQLMLVVAVVAAMAGVLILRARPSHPIGRLLLVVAFFNGFIELTTGYVDWAYATEPVRTGGVVVRMLREFGWSPLLLAYLSVLLRFPTGQPLTPRWRAFERVLWGWLVLRALSIWIPRPMVNHPRVNGMENPLGLEALQPIADVARVAIGVPLLVFVVGAVASLVVRYRGSRGDERQQLKWLLTFASPFLLFVIIIPTWSSAVLSRVALSVVTVLLITGIAVGVLRFRLYDVDLVIRRTVTYAAVSGTLAGTYVLAVAAVAPLLRPVTEGSALSVAVSTLVVVALFNPVRRRMQELVDRRFNRAQFDAAQTIDAFAHRLRDEVDVRRLQDDLAAVAGDTMQPEHVAVWLRRTGVPS